MGIDLRQMMAAILTFSMFVMLGNMIKRDHLDPLLDSLIFAPGVQQYDAFKISKPAKLMVTEKIYGTGKEHDQPAKPCWKKPSFGKEQSNGYIFLSLSHGPEYHASELENAVVVARHLGATLVLPDIIGIEGEKRHLGEIYDVEKFMASLKGVVQVDAKPPTESSNGTLHIVKVPERVTKDFISSNINPIFQSQKNLKIVTYFNSTNATNVKENKFSNAYQCLAMFESLKLQQELQELVDSMVQMLRSLSQKMDGRFLAVDLKVEMLEKNASSWRYNAEEIGEFLNKIGLPKESTIYVTQTGWHSSLNALRNVFPNTFTKDAIMPAEEKAKFMDSKIHEYEKFIDYYMCSEGDAFVPAYKSRFYEGVVGERIGLGKLQIFVPEKNVSDSIEDHISPYIVEKSHIAHSCFCY